MLTPFEGVAAGHPPSVRRNPWRLRLAATTCGIAYAQAFYRLHLWDIESVARLVLLASAMTTGMMWLLARRARDGRIVLGLVVAGVLGLALGVIVDVAISPIAETGGERNLIPFEIALLALFGLPGAVLGSLLGWATRPRVPQRPAGRS
jgi:hypothetical protein